MNGARQTLKKEFLALLKNPTLLLFALIALGFAVVPYAVAATADNVTSTVNNKLQEILCPILNLLSGTIAKIIGVIFLLWAVIQYMTNDSRGAKATAIAAGIGIILILTFPTWQKLFTGMDYANDSPTECLITR